jgi:hypothetical protein
VAAKDWQLAAKLTAGLAAGKKPVLGLERG